MTVKIKRIYEPAEKSDGFRILVDRLWPRGIKKEEALIDLWIKEVAPSTGLRKWFNHEPEKWKEFITRYRAELKESPVFKELLSQVIKQKTITLLFAAKDEKHNHSLVLKQLIGNQ